MAENLETLKARFAALSDAELVRAVTVDASSYRDEALSIAREELALRNITENSAGSYDLRSDEGETASGVTLSAGGHASVAPPQQINVRVVDIQVPFWSLFVLVCKLAVISFFVAMILALFSALFGR